MNLEQSRKSIPRKGDILQEETTPLANPNWNDKASKLTNTLRRQWQYQNTRLQCCQNIVVTERCTRDWRSQAEPQHTCGAAACSSLMVDSGLFDPRTTSDLPFSFAWIWSTRSVSALNLFPSSTFLPFFCGQARQRESETGNHRQTDTDKVAQIQRQWRVSDYICHSDLFIGMFVKNMKSYTPGRTIVKLHPWNHRSRTTEFCIMYSLNYKTPL